MGWLDFDEMIIRLRTLWMNTCLENDIVDTNDEGNFYDDYYLYSLIVFNIYTDGAKFSRNLSYSLPKVLISKRKKILYDTGQQTVVR